MNCTAITAPKTISQNGISVSPPSVSDAASYWTQNRMDSAKPRGPIEVGPSAPIAVGPEPIAPRQMPQPKPLPQPIADSVISHSSPTTDVASYWTEERMRNAKPMGPIEIGPSTPEPIASSLISSNLIGFAGGSVAPGISVPDGDTETVLGKRP